VLDVGEPAWVSGPTAAAIHGFDGYRIKKPFHLTLERGRNVRRLGVIIHTTTDLPLIDRAPGAHRVAGGARQGPRLGPP
jgi:hypothetical protein